MAPQTPLTPSTIYVGPETFPGLQTSSPSVSCCLFIVINFIFQHFKCHLYQLHRTIMILYLCSGRLDRLQTHLEDSFLLSSSLGTQRNTEQMSRNASDLIQRAYLFSRLNSFSIHCLDSLSLRHGLFSC